MFKKIYMAKDKMTTIRMNGCVLEKGKTLAEIYHRSFSNYVEWLILKNAEEMHDVIIENSKNEAINNK